MLSHRPCQSKDSMIQVSLKVTGILFTLLQIYYIHICVHTLGSLRTELISGERLLNGAPASLRFDQWKHFCAEWRPLVGTDPVVGSLCGSGRKWKHKNTQRFVFVPRCLTSLALLISTVSSRSRLTQATAKDADVKPSYLFIYLEYFCLLIKKKPWLFMGWTCKSSIWNNKAGISKGLLNVLRNLPRSR